MVGPLSIHRNFSALPSQRDGLIEHEGEVLVQGGCSDHLYKPFRRPLAHKLKTSTLRTCLNSLLSLRKGKLLSPSALSTFQIIVFTSAAHYVRL